MNDKNKAIEAFDPKKLAEGVRERIRATFVSLIPEEHWDQMIQKESDEYFRKKERSRGYGYDQKVSDFELLVRQELNAECKKRMRVYLDSPEFVSTWDIHGQPVASEAVKNMMVDNAGLILANMFSGMFSQMMEQIKNNMVQY